MDKKLAEWFGEAFDPATMTLRVKFRETVAGVDTDEAVLSEPLLTHIEASTKKTGAESDRLLLALMAGQGWTPGMMALLPASEYRKARLFMDFFLNYGPPTGESEP